MRLGLIVLVFATSIAVATGSLRAGHPGARYVDFGIVFNHRLILFDHLPLINAITGEAPHLYALPAGTSGSEAPAADLSGTPLPRIILALDGSWRDLKCHPAVNFLIQRALASGGLLLNL